MHIFRFPLFFIGVLVLGVQLKAQDVPPPDNFRVYPKVLVLDSTDNEVRTYIEGKNFEISDVKLDSVYLSDSSRVTFQQIKYKCELVFNISTADSVLQKLSKIHVKLGTSAGDSDIYQKVFDSDGASSYSDGSTYYRKNERVRLGTGYLEQFDDFYGEAQLEDDNGNMTDPVKFEGSVD
jgi:hypothetical protein